MSVHLYRLLSPLLSLALILQLFVPVFIQPSPVAAQPAPEAPAATTAVEPAATAPLSLARVQSPVQDDGTMVITYTVSNLQPLAYRHNLPDGATVTETIASLGAFELAADPNTIRNVVLHNEPAAASFGASSPPATTDGAGFLWNLGDLPPQQSREIVLTLDAPAAGADFVELDGGAAAYGDYRGRQVLGMAPPARLAPAGFAQWLIWTPDADIYNQQMLRQAAQLGQEPTALFAYVRDFGYEAYEGSLRGTLGTLWSEAGNSIDQSSLLIAMLRASGIPARYRHGTLSTGQAQELVVSMFPEPTRYLGQVTAGTEVGDPANDPELLSEATDHWWVEAYLPGQGWTDLDPSFATAAVGDFFATPLTDGSDGLAELPAAVRHRLEAVLQIEQYSSFPLGGHSLPIREPLDASFDVVEMVGEPLNVMFAVDTDFQGGLAYSNVIHTYTPYFRLGRSETVVAGESFQDFLTSFPLASSFTTAAWLQLAQIAPDGSRTMYERTVFDLIGAEARLNSGAVTLPPLGNDPSIAPGTLAQVQVTPQSHVPASELERLLADLTLLAPALAAAEEAGRALDGATVEDVAAFLDQYATTIDESQALILEHLGTSFNVAATSAERTSNADNLLVKSYPAQPKLLMLTRSLLPETETMKTTFELLNIRERAIAYPGQNADATLAANVARTLGEKDIEYVIMQSLPAEDRDSGLETVMVAHEQGIPIAYINNSNLADLDALPLPAEARARIADAVLGGKRVFVPEETVEIRGTARSGWIEMDETGHASFVNEAGLQASAAEAALFYLEMSLPAGNIGAFIRGFAAVTFTYVGELLNPEGIQGPGKGFAAVSAAAAVAAAAFAGTQACATTPPFYQPGCWDGFILGMAIIGIHAVSGIDPTVVNYWYTLAPPVGDNPVASGVLSPPATVGGDPLAVAVATDHLLLAGAAETAWSDTVTHGAAAASLAAPDASLSRDGSAVDGGLLLIEENPLTVGGQPLSTTLQGVGSVGFYAAPATGLAGSSAWETYTATLEADTPFTVGGFAAALVDYGAYTTGTLSAEIAATAAVTGSGPAFLPDFAGSADLTLTEGAVLVGPTSGGNATAGATSLDTTNGLAVGGFSGALALGESSGSADQVAFGGSADFFTFGLDSASSTMAPADLLILTPQIAANYDDSYTITVQAPAGWTVAVSGGQVTATPATSVAAGSYRLWVSAQSASYPDLILSAEHVVTVQATDGMALQVEPDTLTTIPMGPIADPDALPGLNGHRANGQVEVPGAAHMIWLTNTSTVSHTFEISVSGLPAGWTVLSRDGQRESTSLTLGAGAVGQMGLYIVPTQSALLAAGTSYPVAVTATAQDNAALTESANFVFTMPGLSFPYPRLAPTTQYVGVGASAAFSLTVENAGNTAGQFSLTAGAYSQPYSLQPISPTLLTTPTAFDTPILAAGAGYTDTVSLDTSGYSAGEILFLRATADAGDFRPMAAASVILVNPGAGDVFTTAGAVDACGVDTRIVAALEALGLAMFDLDASYQNGAYSAPALAAVVTAATSAGDAISAHGGGSDTTDLEAAIAALSGANDDAAIAAALLDVGAAVAALSDDLCQRAQFRPALSLTPVYSAALPGGSTTYALTLENAGSETATYTVTVNLPGSTDSFTETLASGASSQWFYLLDPTELGLYTIEATATAGGPGVTVPDLSAGAAAALNVVQQLVAVTAVTPDPAFVESGSSSTTVSAEVANPANLLQESVAQVAVTAASGAVSYTTGLPLTIPAGQPRTHELATVDTGGWADGVYTVTVSLWNAAQTALLAQNHSYLLVGQGLEVRQGALPPVVAPGDVTVTTRITTVIRQDTILPGVSAPAGSAPVESGSALPNGWVPVQRPALPRAANGDHTPPAARTTEAERLLLDPAAALPPPAAATPVAGAEPPLAADSPVAPAETVRAPLAEQPLAPVATVISGFTRYEETDGALTYNGTWYTTNSTVASSGSSLRANTTGASAGLTFTGDRVGIGFLTGNGGGHAEIFIDGASQGLVDLYRNAGEITAVYYDLLTGTHTLTVAVAGTANPLAANDFVYLDYIDVFNGSVPDGSYEQNDGRLLYGGNWYTNSSGNASGGSYLQSPNGSVWFPFEGDSVSFQAVRYAYGGPTRLYLDGKLVATVDLYSPSAITETYSFAGLGSGGHVLAVNQYRGRATVDRFTTPAVGAPYTEPVQSGFIRYEEDHPALRYNGLPLTITARNWNFLTANYASEGYAAYSEAPGDTISLTFDGQWVNVGLVGGTTGGEVELFLDGVSQGIVDTYRKVGTDPFSLVFGGLAAGTHTISMTVQGTKNPFSTNERVYLDYIEVWDGSVPAAGRFAAELEDDRVQLSNDWNQYSNGAAEDGAYLRSTNGSLWFSFVGESVTYQALANSNMGQAKVYLDGRFITTFEQWSETTVTRTLSFDGLSNGPHVLQIKGYRGNFTADTLVTPGVGPFYTPPPPQAGIARYEEDDPIFLYNGVPFTMTAGTWTMTSRDQSSSGWNAYSATAGDAISMTFAGSWINVGFYASDWGGLVEVFIDGSSQGVVDTYRRYVDSFSVVYDDLGAGPHLLELVVLGANNGRAVNSRIYFDYVDVWDGTSLPDGAFEATLADAGERWYYGGSWSSFSDGAATNGDYLRASDTTAWFLFTGDTLTLTPLARSNTGWAEITIDGEFQTRLNTYAPQSELRPLSFTGLGAGAHVLQVRGYRGLLGLDSASTTVDGPVFTPPDTTGIVRYEENDPALLYNGQHFTNTHTTWNGRADTHVSQAWAARSETSGDTVALTFDGPWVAVGFATGSNRGLAEVFIDGASQGVVDTYSPSADVMSVVYDNLLTTTHTISVTVLGSRNVTSTRDWVYVDYFDVWDGTETAGGWYDADATDQENDRVSMDGNRGYQTLDLAYDGDYYQDSDNVWFRFTGEEVTFQSIGWSNAAAGAEVYIDGQLVDSVSLYYAFSPSPLLHHYAHLGPGAHVMRVHNPDRMRVDAFYAGPAGAVPGVPLVEWWDAAAAGGSGVISTIAAGDVNNDGVVELAVSSNNGTISLYRGDGADAGGGTPLIWQRATQSEPDAPALAQLDGIGDIEIVVGNLTGTVAYHADGSIYWSEPGVTANFPSGGTAIANLDGDDLPEIAVSASSNGGELVVLEHDGTVAWRDTSLGGDASPPVLADLDEDGAMDILVVDPATTRAYLFAYDNGLAPTLSWSYTFSEAIGSLRGSPAIADVDGQQPGGDSGPEVVVATDGWMNLLDADGSLLWRSPLGAGAPGGISVGDTDGDGEVELVTTVQYDGGTVYVFNADGTLLWTAPALDSTSGTSASIHDLDGDGAWEVIWNGAGQGLTIYRGTDGAILFNEPLINSITRRDYPIVVDVDGDGHGEIVAGDHGGVYVVGYDTIWADARPLWNQYNYHVTNINDDLSVPVQEPPSWAIHNTYRTQTPLTNPAPNYVVVMTHTAGVSNTQPLADSFSLPVTAGDPLYTWTYNHSYYQPSRFTSFDTALSGMQPGEVRALSQGTGVVYSLPSGSNDVALPPLYVTAAHLIGIDPASQTTMAGGSAVYTVTLNNPADQEAVYDLLVSGLDTGWVTLPPTATVPAAGSVDLLLTVAVPAAQAAGGADFTVRATAGNGGQDLAPASLTWVDGLALTVTPPFTAVRTGEAVTFTATMTNEDSQTRTYLLAVDGVLGVELPPSITLAGGASQALALPATALPGVSTLTISATEESGLGGAQASASLAGIGARALALSLAPATASGGPGTTIPFTLTVANLGTLSDTFSLDANLPGGWTGAFSIDGAPASAITLPPGVAHSGDLLLTVTPPLTATPGLVSFTVSAQSQFAAGVSAGAEGAVQLLDEGVQIAIVGGDSSLLPSETGSWQIEVTNTGAQAGTFDLSAAGIVARTAQFSTSAVTLNPGQTQSVQLTAGPLSRTLPLAYPFSVMARSQSTPAIMDLDESMVTITALEDVTMGWQPATRTVTDTLEATYSLVITNSGNVGTIYDLTALPGAADVSISLEQLFVPPQTAASVIATVRAPGEGLFDFGGTAASTTSAAAAAAGGSLAVNAFCPAAGPAAADAGIDLQQGALTLTWDPAPRNASGYAPYGSSAPYFTPEVDGAPLDNLAPGSASYLVGAAEDGRPPRYFLIRSLTCAGTQSADSARVGIFGFALEPGQ